MWGWGGVGAPGSGEGLENQAEGEVGHTVITAPPDAQGGDGNAGSATWLGKHGQAVKRGSQRLPHRTQGHKGHEREQLLEEGEPVCMLLHSHHQHY